MHVWPKVSPSPNRLPPPASATRQRMTCVATCDSVFFIFGQLISYCSFNQLTLSVLCSNRLCVFSSRNFINSNSPSWLGHGGTLSPRENSTLQIWVSVLDVLSASFRFFPTNFPLRNYLCCILTELQFGNDCSGKWRTYRAGSENPHRMWWPADRKFKYQTELQVYRT